MPASNSRWVSLTQNRYVWFCKKYIFYKFLLFEISDMFETTAQCRCYHKYVFVVASLIYLDVIDICEYIWYTRCLTGIFRYSESFWGCWQVPYIANLRPLWSAGITATTCFSSKTFFFWRYFSAHSFISVCPFAGRENTWCAALTNAVAKHVRITSREELK